MDATFAGKTDEKKETQAPATSQDQEPSSQHLRLSRPRESESVVDLARTLHHLKPLSSTLVYNYAVDDLWEAKFSTE